MMATKNTQDKYHGVLDMSDLDTHGERRLQRTPPREQEQQPRGQEQQRSDTAARSEESKSAV